MDIKFCNEVVEILIDNCDTFFPAHEQSDSSPEISLGGSRKHKCKLEVFALFFVLETCSDDDWVSGYFIFPSILVIFDDFPKFLIGKNLEKNEEKNLLQYFIQSISRAGLDFGYTRKHQ